MRSRNFGALTRDMHYSTLGHIPGRVACFLCSETKVSFLEIQEIALVEAANGFEHRGPNHHRCSWQPVNGLRRRAHLNRDCPALQDSGRELELKSALDLT